MLLLTSCGTILQNIYNKLYVLSLVDFLRYRIALSEHDTVYGVEEWEGRWPNPIRKFGTNCVQQSLQCLYEYIFVGLVSLFIFPFTYNIYENI